jgi:hypothetical protein
MSSTNGAKPRGHQALNARRLCRDRGRSGLVRPPPMDPAIDADAFDHGGTQEFAAISAVVVRHNHISNIRSRAADRFEPIYRR